MRAKRWYWWNIQISATGLHHKSLRRVWRGHQEKNWEMSDRGVRVHLVEVDFKIQEYKRKENEQRENFLVDQDEAKGLEGEDDISQAVKEINKKEQ